jgi:hypothetical protein
LLYQLMMNNDISAVSKAITVLHSSFELSRWRQHFSFL